MVHALVFDTDLPFLTEGAAPSSLSPQSRMAGLTLLRRTVLLAWKAGAEAVTVVASDHRAAERWRASERDLPVPVQVVEGSVRLTEVGDEDVVLLLSALVYPQPTLVERLVKLAAAGRTVRASAPSAASYRGPVAVPAAELRRLPQETGVLDAARALLERSVPVSAGERGYRHLRDREALEETDRSLYQNLFSTADGYLDRVFNRHISRRFTRLVIDLPVAPNHVTLFHGTLGLTSAALFWQGSYGCDLLGALLLQLSVALDCSDGEIARLKYQFSKFGSWLDVWADNVVTMAVFMAVAHRAASHLGVPTALSLGALAVTGVLMCILVIYSMAKLQSRCRPGEASSLAATNRFSDEAVTPVPEKGTLVDRVINEATSRDFTILIVAAALFGRLDWIAWMAAFGSHAFWMVFASIQLSMLRAANAESR
jgi:phosphatidylglycerophosphate synthase